MTDQNKPPPAGYVWMEIDGKWQLVAIGWRAHSEMIRHELATMMPQQPTQKPTHKEVYERWHRARGQNPKITLQQVCELMDVNYDSIRAARARAIKRKKRK